MSTEGWDDGTEAGLFADVTGKVQSAWATAEERLAQAVAEIRQRGYENGASGARAARLSDCAAEDVPRLLAAVDRALELTDPLRNPTLGGTFLGAVGVQVREAILAELLPAPVLGQGGAR